MSYYIAAGDYKVDEWADYDAAQYKLCIDENSAQASVDGPIEYFDGFSIAVSCCSDDGSTGYRPDCGAYGKTYAEAKTICEDNGYRLCTLQEMLWDRVTESAGCLFDLAYNWVSDECVS